MKRIIFLAIFLGVNFCNTMLAQVILPPAEPNEVCMDAWNNYNKANVLWNTGWGLFGGGLALTSVCAAFGVVSGPHKGSHPPVNQQPETIAINRLCWSLCGIGSASVVASVPCLIVGQVRRKAAIKSYEDWNCSPETCENFQINYKKGDVLWKTGWGLFGSGMGMAVIGTMLVVSYILPTPNAPRTPDVGFALIGVGGGVAIASIPCIAVGQVRLQASRNLYNRRCVDQPPLTFSINSSSNGLGLAMQF